MRISDWSSDVCSSDLADQCGGGREADGQAPLAGGQAEPEGDMSLARAAGTERDDILAPLDPFATRSEEHTSELQSLMRISYAVFCLKKKKRQKQITQHHNMYRYD